MATTLANISIKDSSSWNTYLNLIYPVGSYYLSNASTSPSSRFGGTWTQITGQRFLCGDKSVTTGGANSVTLSISQMPAHQHARNVATWASSLGGLGLATANKNSDYLSNSNHDSEGENTGGARVTKTDPCSALAICGTELRKLFTSKGGE